MRWLPLAVVLVAGELTLCLPAAISHGNDLEDDLGDVFTNDFAVEVNGDFNVADLVAGTHGFKLVRQVRKKNIQ